MNTATPFPDKAMRHRLRSYIDQTWDVLTRELSHPTLAAVDTKVPDGDLPETVIYISGKENPDTVQHSINSRLPPSARVKIRVLPTGWEEIMEHGLLYLPGAYVVPGGRFNEFYGWDSYFIYRGVSLSGKSDLARSIVDQALYQVDHYGMVLNANRTYYLTRSHPPFLSLMVKHEYLRMPSRSWLLAALPLVEKYYYYWKVPPHFDHSSGLSRYYDLGEGPAPEVAFSELDDEGRNHYERMKDFLRSADIASYDKNLFYDSATDQLTPLAYKGDRTMRESGFDPTSRFGPLNLDVIHYAPLCLNVLLYQMEKDLAELHGHAGDTTRSADWAAKAAESARTINRVFWNETTGLYSDYHLGTRELREYPFLTTFWPLWAGVATAEQARLVKGNLRLFLEEGGLRTSIRETGAQWDAPFAWAPLQLMAVAGLEAYGYATEAREVAARFTSMVADTFQETGLLFEKYDATRSSGSVEDKIKFGYNTNEPGFGWTNAVVLEFLEHYHGDDTV